MEQFAGNTDIITFIVGERWWSAWLRRAVDEDNVNCGVHLLLVPLIYSVDSNLFSTHDHVMNINNEHCLSMRSSSQLSKKPFRHFWPHFSLKMVSSLGFFSSLPLWDISGSQACHVICVFLLWKDLLKWRFPVMSPVFFFLCRNAI